LFNKSSKDQASRRKSEVDWSCKNAMNFKESLYFNNASVKLKKYELRRILTWLY